MSEGKLSIETKEPPRRKFLKAAGKILIGAGIALSISADTSTEQRASLVSRPVRAWIEDSLVQSGYEPVENIWARIQDGVLERWANERTFIQNGEYYPRQILRELPVLSRIGNERQARTKVALKIQEDLQKGPGNVPLEAETYAVIQKLTKVLKPNQSLMVSAKDTVTNEQINYIVLAEVVNGTLIYRTEERKAVDNSIISAADFNPANKHTRLTLNFAGERYVDANPDIKNDPRFPRAAQKVLTLVATNILNQRG